MDLDFDKEIDTLLRKARDDRGMNGGDTAEMHLDADGIAAFAENALPEKTRVVFTMHLADCGRCRKILSNVIAMNVEAGPETAFVAAPVMAAASVPWYQKLFVFPNMAYVMGSLVLLFGGFFAYSVLLNSEGSLNSEVSQVADTQQKQSGPSAIFDEPNSPAAANTAMNSANAMSSAENKMVDPPSSIKRKEVTAPDVNSAPAAARSTTDVLISREDTSERDKNMTLDGVDAMSGKPAPLPFTAVPEDRAKDEKGDMALVKNKKNKADDKQDSLLLSTRQMSEMPLSDARGRAKTTGPRNNQQNITQNQAANESEASVTRSVGGKNFQRKEGVWYDSAYHGQTTVNIGRGTDAFKKLDAGLRTIANTLDGVVVTVWKNKAYRIQ